MVGLQQKLTKKKQWLKRPNVVLPKKKFGPKYK